MKRNRRQLANQVASCAIAAGALAVCHGVGAAADVRSTERILHFPQDRSLGPLYMWDASAQRKMKDYHPWIDGVEHEYLGEATGVVTVPAGKRVSLRLNRASGNNLSPLRQLGGDDLHALGIADTADYRCLPHLVSLTGLKKLSFPRATSSTGNFPVFPAGSLRQLAAFKSLECLGAPDQLGDEGLAILADALPQLQVLDISRNQLTDRGLAALSKFTALEELSIGGGSITGRGLASLENLRSLYYLSLWGSFMKDDTLLQVRKVPSLTILRVPITITDAGLTHLAGHPTLENLDLYNTKVTDGGLVHLKSLPSLKALNLRKREYDLKNPPFTDAGTVHLKAIKTLEQLDLPADGLSDTGLTNLAELGHLKKLGLPMPYYMDRKYYRSFYSEKGILELTRIGFLESLDIAGPGVTDAALSHIAQMTNLRSLSFYGCPVSNEGLAKLVALRSLESVNLYSHLGVTVSGLNCLNGLTRLSSLRADSLTQDGPPLNLTNLTSLKSLVLVPKRGSTFWDDDLAGLANLKQLKSLQLGSTKLAITDAGMAYLAGLTSLEDLIVGGCGVTDRGLAYLANMRKLNRLKFGGSFTDMGLEQLADLKGLGAVWIYSGDNLSPAAKARLRQNLSNLHHLIADRDATLGRPDQAASTHPIPGALAPDFSVTTLDGAEFTLSEHRGKVVLLHFWATWSAASVDELPPLQRYHDHLKRKYGRRVVLLGVVMDDTDQELQSLVHTHKLTTPQARIGRHSELASAYGVKDAPDDFMIGPDGRILLNQESPEDPSDTEAFIDRALAWHRSKREQRGANREPVPPIKTRVLESTGRWQPDLLESEKPESRHRHNDRTQTSKL